MRWSVVAATIAMALILGIGYAQWAEQGSITVALGFSYIDLDADLSNKAVDKSSSHISIDVVSGREERDGVDDGPPEVSVSITGLYPGAYARVNFSLRVDSGSLPINVTSCRALVTSLIGNSTAISVVELGLAVGGASARWTIGELVKGGELVANRVAGPGTTIPVSITVKVPEDAPEELQGAKVTVAITCQAVGSA